MEVHSPTLSLGYLLGLGDYFIRVLATNELYLTIWNICERNFFMSSHDHQALYLGSLQDSFGSLKFDSIESVIDWISSHIYDGVFPWASVTSNYPRFFMKVGLSGNLSLFFICSCF